MAKCRTRGCARTAAVADWCASHAKKVADKRFSLEIREPGFCEAQGSIKWYGPIFECKGHLQCAHLISRRYKAVRWNHDNAVCLCAAHHMWLDTHPLEKDRQIDRWLGKERHEVLRTEAIAYNDVKIWRPILEAYLLNSEEDHIRKGQGS